MILKFWFIFSQVNEKINMESHHLTPLNLQILKKKPKIEVSTGSIEFDLDEEHKKVTSHKKTVSLDSFLEVFFLVKYLTTVKKVTNFF